jgi:hypothetical protein
LAFIIWPIIVVTRRRPQWNFAHEMAVLIAQGSQSSQTTFTDISLGFNRFSTPGLCASPRRVELNFLNEKRDFSSENHFSFSDGNKIT